MAKPLVVEFDGLNIEFDMNRIDRAKLYGYKEVEVLDEHGEKCDVGILAEDGHTLIGRGGTGFAYLSADGQWCDKSQLRPVDLAGQTLTPVASSFAAPIRLTEEHRTTADDYLNHSIRSVYQMASTSDSHLIQEIKRGALYKFAYSFRGGLEADTAFLLANDAGAVFLAVGRPATIGMVGLQQAAAPSDEDAIEEEDGDDMDFGMI
ncbi:MAG: hypothetical protein Q8M16_11125 [Pirellulaceae bacterium]|nr:hypothetical protein [Pirellulaceae bacterium]